MCCKTHRMQPAPHTESSPLPARLSNYHAAAPTCCTTFLILAVITAATATMCSAIGCCCCLAPARGGLHKALQHLIHVVRHTSSIQALQGALLGCFGCFAAGGCQVGRLQRRCKCQAQARCCCGVVLHNVVVVCCCVETVLQKCKETAASSQR